jgi:hypothetical protein
MGNIQDLLMLVVLGGAVAAWLKLARARELAVQEVRRQCERHGLQLLDETVGLRSIRLRRNAQGIRIIERGYSFEVSIDGDDRESGRVWMSGQQLTALSLPTIEWRLQQELERIAAAPGSNVVQLRPPSRDRSRPH